MTRLCVVTSIISLVASSYSFAQDYIVTSKGDTVRGFIKLQSYDVDRVQIIADGKKNHFTAMQIRTVFLKGEIYHPIRISNTYRFMKLLRPGYLSLYAFREPDQFTYDGRYIVKRDGASLEVPNLMFKDIMGNFLRDCPAVETRIEKGFLNRNKLDEIVEQYNQIMEEEIRKLNLATGATQSSQWILLENLKKKVKVLPDSPDKSDALDLLQDVGEKLKQSQPVPRYMLRSLQNFLANKEAVKEDTQKFVEALKSL